MPRPGQNQELSIEAEIRAEKASSLRRVAHTLEGLLVELGRIEAALKTLTGEARATAVAEHRRLRAEAERQQWYLIVQREAMGMRHHRDVYEIYRIPPAVK